VIAGPSAPTPPLSLRFGARAGDVVFTFPAGMALSAAAALAYKHFTGDVHVAYVLAGWAVAWALVLLPVAWLRWRRWVRIDDAGVTLMRPRGRVLVELSWEEVEGIAQVGHQGIELRGAGRAIRISDAFERVGESWAWIRTRCEGRIFDILSERLRRGEAFELRTATSRVWAQVVYLGLTVFLAGMTAFYAWTFWQGRRGAEWGAIIPVVVWILVILPCRRQISSEGGWIRVAPEGLIVKRLDARWELAWKEITRLTVLPRKGWCLERNSGKPVQVPATLFNLRPLWRLVAERTGSA
jgi:hypothetical protein